MNLIFGMQSNSNPTQRIFHKRLSRNNISSILVIPPLPTPPFGKNSLFMYPPTQREWWILWSIKALWMKIYTILSCIMKKYWWCYLIQIVRSKQIFRLVTITLCDLMLPPPQEKPCFRTFKHFSKLTYRCV